MPEPDRTAVLFDVDGTLVDAGENQRRIWALWADLHGLDSEQVYVLALRSRPADTVARFLPHPARAEALAQFQRLEDDDVREGDYRAFAGAGRLLRELEAGSWALVTANIRRRVEGRFRRLELPIPPVIVDAESTILGKPDPEPYLAAATALQIVPARCLVIEDSQSGVSAGIAAGMTVWSVNSATPPYGTHRHFRALEDATEDIIRFVA